MVDHRFRLNVGMLREQRRVPGLRMDAGGYNLCSQQAVSDKEQGDPSGACCIRALYAARTPHLFSADRDQLAPTTTEGTFEVVDR